MDNLEQFIEDSTTELLTRKLIGKYVPVDSHGIAQSDNISDNPTNNRYKKIVGVNFSLEDRYTDFDYDYGEYMGLSYTYEIQIEVQNLKRHDRSWIKLEL